MIAIIAKRYARAFFKLFGHDTAQAQRHIMALSSVRSLFALDDARRVLVSPVMPAKLKQQLLDYALDLGKADELVRHFIGTLVEARRVELIPTIITACEDLLNEMKGRLQAVVVTAVPLAPPELESLRAQLQETFAKKVDIKPEVNADILGGMVVRIGYRLIDLSIKSRLNALTTSAAL